MEHLIIPEGYKPILSLRETQAAIKIIKDFFQRELAKQLNLDAVHDTVHEMAKDEARHGRGFKGLFDRYFGE